MKRAGILEPVFSLPGRFGIGDFGPGSFEFIDILADAGMKIWQVLPLNPLGYGESPYQPFSSFAGETLYVDLDSLYEDGLLKRRPRSFRKDAVRVDYQAVRQYKEKYFREAFRAFEARRKPAGYRAFTKEEWVYPYAMFITLKKKNGMVAWTEWPKEDRDWILKREKRPELDEAVRYEIFLQYEFRIQWLRIKAYANARGILLMGDIPFYVGQDSLDVWMNQEEFLLDKAGYPEWIAGVPPDYFSATGQRWGNPIYNWAVMEANGFRFWRNRVKGNAVLFDMIRIDHFRAFDTYWKIHASCPTAMEGSWIEAPGYQLFDKLLPEIPNVEIVAEDLGMMRDEVYVLRDHYAFPGMNVLQFTLLDEKFKLREHMITYTGTHDNDTVEGWWKTLPKEEQKKYNAALKGRGILISKGTKAEQFVRLAFETPTETAIVPVWDVLSLPGICRINVPGLIDPRNWTCRQPSLKALKAAVPGLRALAEETHRI